MRIRKISESTPTNSNVVNEYSISTEDTYSANYVEGLHTYSTDEVRVGTYEDGKPIYRKRLTGTKVSGTDLSLNVSNNLKKIIDISAQLMVNSDFGYKMPFYESNDVFTRIELSNSNNYIKIKSGTSSYANGTIEAIVLYTKTTD